MRAKNIAQITLIQMPIFIVNGGPDQIYATTYRANVSR